MSDLETRVHQPVPEEDGSRFLGLGKRGVIFAGILVGLLVIAGGVLAALFLFNGSAGELITLDGDNPTATHPDGITISLADGGTLRFRLDSVPRELFLGGVEDKRTEGALAAIPSYLDMKSPLYILDPQNEAGVNISIAIPNASEPYHTLDLYAWDTEAGKWIFVPSHVDMAGEIIRTDALPDMVAVFQTSPLAPLLGTTLESGYALEGQLVDLMNLVMPAGYFVSADGTITGMPVEGWQAGFGYAVVPVLRAADTAALSGLLNMPASLSLHINEIKSIVLNNNYNGVVIDYQGLAAGDREAFAGFIADLSAAMREENKAVIVVLPTPSEGADGWDTAGYDWRAIGASADLVIVSTGDNPGDFAISGKWVNMLAWAVGEVSRHKMYVASSVFSYDETNRALLSFEDALEPLGAVAVNPEESIYDMGSSLSFNLTSEVTEVLPDQNTGAYIYSVAGDSGAQRVWIMPANAVRARMDILSTFNIAGMSLDDLGAPGNDTALAQAINEFKTKSVSSVASQIMMKWTLSDASGGVLLSNQTGLGTPWVWNAGTSGKFTILGAIVGSSNHNRGSVDVEVAEEVVEATETPTPVVKTPTPTPTVKPPSGTAQPTAQPTQTETPTPTQNPGSAPPPVAVPGWGMPFAIGGQVPGYISHPGEMNSARMTWVKYQQKWQPGLDPSVVAGLINDGRAYGFKVLLSIPGQLYPDSIDFNAYVEFLRGVAAYQPDAIEIWNEMNLDREWPTGQISPTSYVNNMLAPAFNAIKSVSPGTKVIIGALAPTGFDNDINAWSDLRYVQGMSAAGAANYADCIGAHHNSGTTSPYVRSGRPEGDHYSWYFMPTVDVYYFGMGGALPVCVTEFGYLSPEGYNDPLPATFAWAANTTVAQQTQWLAEGVQIAAGSGYIPLVIIWNVDFLYWSQSDPVGGYAIIRPNGSCPACGSLAGAVP